MDCNEEEKIQEEKRKDVIYWVSKLEKKVAI